MYKAMCANCCYLGSEFLISRLLAGLVRFAPVLVLLCRFGGKLISESKNNHTEDSRHQWDSVILGCHGLRVNTAMRLSMSMCENKAEKFTQSNIHNTCIGHLFIFRRMPRSPDLLFQSHPPSPHSHAPIHLSHLRRHTHHPQTSPPTFKTYGPSNNLSPLRLHPKTPRGTIPRHRYPPPPHPPHTSLPPNLRPLSRWAVIPRRHLPPRPPHLRAPCLRSLLGPRTRPNAEVWGV